MNCQLSPVMTQPPNSVNRIAFTLIENPRAPHLRRALTDFIQDGLLLRFANRHNRRLN
jgi:hypothetical protein